MTATTFARALWFWAKVVLVLALIDVLLFGTGWFWEIPYRSNPGTAAARRIAKALGDDPDGPLAIALGSSVVRMGVNAAKLDGNLRRKGVPSTFRNFGVDGVRMDLAALLNDRAGEELEPWLVILGAAFRDFMPGDQPGAIETHFAGPLVPVESLRPDSLDEWIGRGVGEFWTLYRYRRLVRETSVSQFERLSLSTPAHARPPRTRGPVARFDRGFIESESWGAWKRWAASRTFADYEAYLATRGDVPDRYRERRERARKFVLEESPLLDALDWLLRANRERGIRTVLIYFPENPVFRDPAADAYFDPALSDAVAHTLARAAERYGARFLDMRNALEPEDFVDMVHPNNKGRQKLSNFVVSIIRQEYAEAQNAAATEGRITP